MEDFYYQIEVKDVIPLELYQSECSEGLDTEEYLFLWNCYEPKLIDLDFWLDVIPSGISPSKVYGKNLFYVVFPASCNLLIKVSAIDMLKSSNTLNSNEDWSFENSYFGEISKLNSSSLYSSIIEGKYPKLTEYLKCSLLEDTSIKHLNSSNELSNSQYDQTNIKKQWKLPLFENYINNYKWTRAELKVTLYNIGCLVMEIFHNTRLDPTKEQMQIVKLEHKKGSNSIIQQRFISYYEPESHLEITKPELITRSIIVFDN